MALELLLRNTNFYQYPLCGAPYLSPLGPDTPAYPPCSIAGGIYRETITLIESFVYHAAGDRHYLIVWVNKADYPGWDVVRVTIHPETGAVLEKAYLGSDFAVVRAATSSLWNGGMNKTFALYTAYPYSIVEVDPLRGFPVSAQISNPVVTSLQIPMLSAATYVNLVCPERKKLVSLSTSEGLVVYSYGAYPAAGVKLHGNNPWPELHAWSGGYEDDEQAWFLFSGSLFGAVSHTNQALMKYNFQRNRIELLSELQASVVPDTMGLVCFDTKRKKLAAVRIKADNPDGSPNNAFEVYAPKPAMTRITVPVNITRLAPDVRTTFRTHLLGTKAEGGGSRVVEVSNVSVLGTLTRKQVYTEESGVATFDYQSSTDGMSDTITAQFDEAKVIA